MAVGYSLFGVATATAQTFPASAAKNGETFMVSGTVVNSVTGEGIGRALVRVNGFPQRTSFSDSEGHFEIDGLAAGHVNITVQKPATSTSRTRPSIRQLGST